MQTIELIKSAIQSLKANKKRSFLTIIGIMIGIAAVIRSEERRVGKECRL